MLYWIHLAIARFELTMLVVIGTDCIGSCKSNYHTSMITMTPTGFIYLFMPRYINWNLVVYGRKIEFQLWKESLKSDGKKKRFHQ